MPIRLETPLQEIQKYIDTQVDRMRQVALRNLAYIGERCVNKARTDGSYKDQTGNLRSSLGYVITVDGRVVQQGGFVQSTQGTDRRTGQTEGKEYAESLAARYPQGMTLIVVAGMNYAVYVAAKGREVLDGAELLAESLARKLLKN